MRIVIAGAGEVGTHLAKMLSNEEQNIYLMDADAKKLERAAHHLEVLPVEGSPTLLEDLERAHVEGADLFVAVTPDESANIMASMLAKRVGAKRTIAKVSPDIEIALIEIDKEKCLKLSEQLPPNVEIYHGDGRDPEIIKEVNLEDAQVFVSLTENSETNVLACLAAKRYKVYKTVAKEENIDYIPLAYRLDIGTLINKKLLAAGYIYRILLGQETGQVTCLSLVNNAEVVELVARRDSKIVGRRISELKLPPNITFGGMVRNGQPCMVEGDTILEPYDHVVIFYHDISINELQRLF